MSKKYDERLINAFCQATKRDENTRRADICREAVLRMEGYLSEDVDRLQEIIRNPETSAQVRVNAINLLMTQLANWRTATDIEARLLALEEQVEKQT